MWSDWVVMAIFLGDTAAPPKPLHQANFKHIELFPFIPFPLYNIQGCKFEICYLFDVEWWSSYGLFLGDTAASSLSIKQISNIFQFSLSFHIY